MFKARLKESGHWKDLFEAINAVITETNIEISEDEFKIVALGSMRVVMLSLVLKKEDFEVYECPAGETYRLGVNLMDLLKIIKRGKSDDNITLQFDPEDRHLYINMERPDKKKTKTFSLSLIDIEEEEPPFDQLMQIDLANVLKLSSEHIEEALNDAVIYTDAIKVAIDSEQGIIFKTEGSIGNLEYVLGKEEFTPVRLDQDCEAVFTIKKFKNILKIASLVDEVEFALDVEKPARFVFELFSNSQIVYFLAPRVESDTDEYE